MGYPYIAPDCRGPLCNVHGDPRDTSIALPREIHYDDEGYSCVCSDGRHDSRYVCRGQRTMVPAAALRAAAGELRGRFPGPCCGDGAGEV